MQAGATFGMHTLDQHLANLVKSRTITYEVGLEKCHHPEDFNRLCITRNVPAVTFVG